MTVNKERRLTVELESSFFLEFMSVMCNKNIRRRGTSALKIPQCTYIKKNLCLNCRFGDDNEIVKKAIGLSIG